MRWLHSASGCLCSEVASAQREKRTCQTGCGREVSGRTGLFRGGHGLDSRPFIPPAFRAYFLTSSPQRCLPCSFPIALHFLFWGSAHGLTLPPPPHLKYETTVPACWTEDDLCSSTSLLFSLCVPSVHSSLRFCPSKASIASSQERLAAAANASKAEIVFLGIMLSWTIMDF